MSAFTPDKRYTVLVPRLDFGGPTNLALALAREALASGYNVRVLYIKGINERESETREFQVSRFRAKHVLSLKGVVHSHGFFPDVWNALVKAVRWRHVFSISTVHMQFGEDLAFLYPPAIVAVSSFAFCVSRRFLDKTVTISGYMHDYYLKSFFTFDSIVVNNCHTLSATDSFPLSSYVEFVNQTRAQGKTVLLYVGAFIQRKNIFKLCEYVSSSRHYSLACLGTGPLLSACAASCNHSRNVMFFGQVEDTIPYMRFADFLVLPSHSEGMPLVVLDAASIGLPVIASDIAPHRELEDFGLCRTFDHLNFIGFDQAIGRAALSADSCCISAVGAKFSPCAVFSHYEALWSGGYATALPPAN